MAVGQGLPDKRDVTLIPGISQFPAATGNALQDELVRAWKAMRGEDPLIGEEFGGDTLNRSTWVNPDAAIITVIDDAAGGGIGAAKFAVAAGTTKQLETRPLKIGTLDFRMSFRVRVPTFATTAFNVGIMSGTAAEKLRLMFNPFAAGAGDFIVEHGATQDLANGLAPSGAAYHHYEIWRLNGVAYWFADGVLFAQYNFAADIAAGKFSLEGINPGGGAASDYRVDHAKLWVSRSSVGVAGGSAGHTEGGYSAITAGAGNTHEYLDVVFGAPFPGATGADGYEVDVSIRRTNAADPLVTWDLESVTANGFRIKFSADFDGEVRWRAYK